MPRHDFAFPFRIDGASRQAQRTPYALHVSQMIRQVLLTSPGERIDLPEFGCGLRQLIFAPNSDELKASTQLLVLQALNRWLSQHIQVIKVSVDKEAPEGELRIDIEYRLLETQTAATTRILVS
jgi:phage baseplate assembly protein W